MISHLFFLRGFDYRVCPTIGAINVSIPTMPHYSLIWEDITLIGALEVENTSKRHVLPSYPGPTQRRKAGQGLGRHVYLVHFLLIFVVPSFCLARRLQEPTERWLLSSSSSTHDVQLQLVGKVERNSAKHKGKCCNSMMLSTRCHPISSNPISSNKKCTCSILSKIYFFFCQ